MAIGIAAVISLGATITEGARTGSEYEPMNEDVVQL